MTAITDVYEIVFSFDTTGSMYKCLEEVRSRLREIVKELRQKIPGIRISIFAHGDYCDKNSSYVTKYIDFSNNADTLCNFVKTVGATHGGDAPECYELVMREVQTKLSWSPHSHKSLVLIGDAPPHEPSEAQNYLHLDWRVEAVSLRNMGVKIYAVECYGRSTEFYHRISSQTFGYYLQLSNIKEVKELLIKICFREAGLSHLIEGGTSGTISSLAAPIPTATYDLREKLPDSQPPPSFGLKAEALNCHMCNVGKLSEEFPPETLTEKCEHSPTICLRCLVEHAKKNGSCPHKGCGKTIPDDSMYLDWFQAILDEMFLDYNEVLAANQKKAVGSDQDMICVSTINGDTLWVEFDADKTVQALKEDVKKRFSVEPKQQKLLFNDTTLKVGRSGKLSRLSDFSVAKNSTIHLLIPLYCVPEDLNHVVFDLSWDFPRSNPDFLDASCFAFNKGEFVQLIDWNHSNEKFYLNDSVRHSEKNILKDGKTGHQTIDVYLKKVPSSVSHIFFTLSSWKSPNLSAFSNPSLHFYEASDKEMDLCETTFTHALSSQAVILCYAVRDMGQWQIFECQETSALVNGNAKQYEPIRKRISQLITEADEE